jgi:hypothetical protein
MAANTTIELPPPIQTASPTPHAAQPAQNQGLLLGIMLSQILIGGAEES